MKTSTIILFLSLVIACLCFDNAKERAKKPEIYLNVDVHTIASSIVEIIDKFYIQGFRQFRVRIYGEFTPHLRDVINGIGIKINERSPLLIEHFLKVDNKTCTFEQSTVILTSTSETLKEVIKLSMLTNLGERPLRFIGFSEQIHQYDDVFFDWLGEFDGHMMDHFYFVVNKLKVIGLMKFMYFTEAYCNIPQGAFIDIFNAESQKWLLNLERAENGRRFAGCLIPISVNLFGHGYYFENRGELDKRKNVVGSFLRNMNGVCYQVHEIMSKMGNFTTLYQANTDIKNVKEWRNGVPLFIKKQVLSYQFKALSQTDIFFPYVFTREYFFLLTPSETYTNYEKILFPFDLTSWILFTLSFCMTLLAIAIVNRQPRETQAIIIGSNIRHPTYNVVGVFFGIAQMRLPRENCPRILLTFFVYLCLIFRTCYQGRMFDFMTSDMTKPDPETIDELIDRGYTINSMTDLSEFGFHDERKM
jgi:hypothetical protein